MDWTEISKYRVHIAVGLAVLLLVGWYRTAYQPRRERVAVLEAREQSVARDRAEVNQQILQVEAEMKTTERRTLPSRVAPALARDMSPVDRLNFFLGNITEPANALALSYFTVTPLAPTGGEGYEEIPFSISVAGSYAALGDFLYQLEYGRDFLVRDLAITPRDSAIQADFRLSALLLTDPAAEPAAKTVKDPGRPTSLELARDPFIKPPAKLVTAPDGKSYFLNVPAGLHLTGFMESGRQKVAIINHEPYPVGASIENKTITRITDRGVELSDKVRSYFLEMEQPAYSTTSRPKSPATVNKEVSAR